MANDRKIDPDTPNLLVKYRSVVKMAAENGVREALAMHKARGNPVAVSRDGKMVLIPADEIGVGLGSLDTLPSESEER